ncbi:hypothetical protein GG496_000639 [Candidatus Fervidibacteria bacterium JGI MDM2 JNZ-1-D12]
MKGRIFLAVSVLTAMVFALLGCTGGRFVQGDRQPPRIEQVQVSPDTLIAMGRQVTVTAKVVDAESGLREVVAEVTYPDGSSTRVPLFAQDGYVFQGNFVANWRQDVPLEIERWVMKFVVKAMDNAGNPAQSQEITVKAAIPPPNLPPEF